MKKILFFLCVFLALAFVPMSMFADGEVFPRGNTLIPIGAVVIAIQGVMLLAYALSEFFSSLSEKTKKGDRAAWIYYVVSVLLKWGSLWWFLIPYRLIGSMVDWIKARKKHRRL